ncbi:MAG: hypothetical protein ACRCWI_08345 [Brevinema sp.]
MRFYSSSSPLLSILSMVLGIFLLFYLWLPLLIIFTILGVIFLIISYFPTLFRPSSGNIHIKVVKIHHPTQQDNNNYIDSTTADKDQQQ